MVMIISSTLCTLQPLSEMYPVVRLLADNKVSVVHLNEFAYTKDTCFRRPTRYIVLLSAISRLCSSICKSLDLDFYRLTSKALSTLATIVVEFGDSPKRATVAEFGDKLLVPGGVSCQLIPLTVAFILFLCCFC